MVGDLGGRVRIGLGLGLGLVEIVEIEFSCYFEFVDSTDEGLGPCVPMTLEDDILDRGALELLDGVVLYWSACQSSTMVR